MSKNTLFTGAGVAIVTPMYEDGSVNLPGLRALTEEQIEGGIDAIIACGTTGESATLSHEEHIAVMQAVIDQASGRVPVICGTGSNDTAYAISLSQEAKALGADGLLLVTPYYNKTSQRGLIAHYTAIADAVRMPLILYNVPSRTGVDIKPETYAALADNPYIVGIKEANGNLSSAAHTAALCGDKVALYSGNDDQVVPLLALGGKGVISVVANVAPRPMHDMVARFLAGDVAGARELQLHYLALSDALFSDVNPIPVKEALNLMGRGVGPCRLPLYAMDDAARDKLAAVLRQYDLLAAQ